MATATVTDISAQRKAALINKYASLASQLAKVKAELELCKADAISLLGEGVFETSSSRVTIKWVERDVFDQATAKTLLTAGQLAQCVKSSTFYDVRVKLL